MSQLHYITKLPKNPIENPVMLLMLHGYGSNEEDLFSFAHELPEDLLIVSARAPLTLGFGGYAWYSINFNEDAGKFSDIPQALEARELLVAFLDELHQKYQYNTQKSMLMGFSQGAILSYAVALTYPEKIQNILALSGYVLPDIIRLSTDEKALSQLRFFCSHGSVDPVIPVAWARKSDQFLTEKNIQHIYKEYPAGHGVAPQNFYDLKHWIDQTLQRL